jgi:hypothetical protein
MLVRDRGKITAVGRIARFTAALVVASLCAAASEAAPAPVGTESAAGEWVQKEVNFRYVGFTTKYSCDGLQERLRGILLQLGARDDLRVTAFGCMRASGPETTPGVRIVMHVLHAAGAAPGQSVAAHWKTVDVLADRDPFDSARDCELISQLKRDVLPLFSPRHVDYRATCSVGTQVIGGTQLKADVLVADAMPAAGAGR